jgi:16S rRNA (guanine1207-N2)-methyltransferase
MKHYFTNEDISSNPKIIEAVINNVKLTFKTDNGIFSKEHVDYATKFLLETIDLTKVKGKILDLGCGYGVIGIYLSKVCNINVDMIDINERAVALTKYNAKLNEVDVNVFISDGFTNVKNKYDLIVTNPPIRVGKKIMYDLLFSSFNYLNEGGKLILVINKNQGAKSLIKDLEKEHLVTILNKSRGFYVISCEKH